ncbi:MAG: class I SAM-dependent methyltransferase [Dehalococcoidales bacterium]|nr:class I SAM-dependent methyltransferase [Dehalococcoidales bacterium]
MSEETNNLIEYYSTFNELNRLEYRRMEYDVTWRYFEEYLPSAGKILEIGAGPGRYTVPLAKRGYTVTSTDITPKLVEQGREQIRAEQLEDRVTCFVADARDLSAVGDTDYDVVMLMGPLYHLMKEEDRQEAVEQAYAHLKPGGVIFSSFISRYGIWCDVLQNAPEMIEKQDAVLSVLEDGNDLPGAGFRAHYALISEIAPLHEQAGFSTLVIAGVEPLGITANDDYKKLSEAQRELWLDLMFRISAEPSLIGVSCHLLYVGKKDG